MFGKPLGHLRDVVWLAGDDAYDRTGPFRPSSATLIEMVSLWTSIPPNDLTACMSQVLLSTGEPKLGFDSSRDIQT